MKITQRTANLEDAAVLLAWRNNPIVRKFSLHSELIQSDEHLGWLTARLERIEYEPFFLFTAAHEVVGMSRLDLVFESTDKYEISIIVDPNHHGKGLGTKILNMTSKKLSSFNPGSTILARVHSNNFISQKLFSNAGFQFTHSVKDCLHYEKIF